MSTVILDAATLGVDLDLTPFNQFGDLTIFQATSNDKIIENCEDATIVILNKVVMGAAEFSKLKFLKIICLTATGYNNIDTVAAQKAGIAVCNVAGYSTDSVAQHTIAMLLYQMQHLKYYDNYIKDGNYSNSPIFTHIEKPWGEIKGKKWGIIGMGNIGRKVAKIGTAFGAKVSYFSTSGVKRDEDYPEQSMGQLIKESDIISIHAPLNPKTIDLISFKQFENCKRNLILLNLGRGGIVNESALAQAIDKNLIAGACVDVLTSEPVKQDNPLVNIKNRENIFITPHIAWASSEARNRVVTEICENIKAFRNGIERNRV